MSEQKQVTAPNTGAMPRPYHTPVLRVYGAMHELTRAVGKIGTVADGGALRNKTKTS